MADEDASPEDRTIEPSLRRQEEFRREGRVAMSRDVMSAAHLMALALGFSMFGAELYESLRESTRVVMYRVADVDVPLWEAFVGALSGPAGAMLAIAGIGIVGLLAAGLGQTKMLFSLSLIGFKMSRINPLEKIKELFGPTKATVRVSLAASKVLFTALVLWMVVAGSGTELQELSLTSIEYADVVSKNLLWEMLMGTIASIVVLATVDYAWQRRQLNGKIMMTPEEAKRDHQQAEGKPEYKQRRRQMHRELTANKILESVPMADVVITNPTHLAIALRYRAGEDEAPIVTAKGADALAAIMRDVARQHAVPLVENKPMARTLWRKVKVGGPVPRDMFVEVAEVLARVYKAKRVTPLAAEASPSPRSDPAARDALAPSYMSLSDEFSGA